MKNAIIQLFMVVIISLIITSCQTNNTEISEHETVVNGIFSPRDTFYLTIQSSIKMPSFIELYNGQNELIDTLIRSGLNLFKSQKIADTLGCYTIRFSENDKIISATDCIPLKPIVNHVTTNYYAFTDIINEGYYQQISFHLKDAANETNYYGIRVLLTDSTYEGYNSIYYYYSDMDIFTDENLIAYKSAIIPFSDQLFDGQEKDISFYFSSGWLRPNSTKVHFIVYSLSENYYNYLKSAILQNASNTLGTLGNPASVVSNIENGIGIFGAYNYYYQILDCK